MEEQTANVQGQEPPADQTPAQKEGLQQDQARQEKSFTQAEVDQIVAARLARVKHAVADGDPKKVTAPRQDDSEMDTMKNELYTARLETALTAQGVDEKRLARAMRLIDKADCLNDNGYPDAAKIKDKVAELMKDWPELKAAQKAQEATAEEAPPARQRWGAASPPKGSKTVDAEAELKKAFGIKT